MNQAINRHLGEVRNLAPLAVDNRPEHEFAIAPCENCANIRTVKRELRRINRQLGNLREQIENAILSLE